MLLLKILITDYISHIYRSNSLIPFTRLFSGKNSSVNIFVILFPTVIIWFSLLKTRSIKHLLYMMIQWQNGQKARLSFLFSSSRLSLLRLNYKMNIIIKGLEIYISNNGACQIFISSKMVRIYKMFLKVKL